MHGSVIVVVEVEDDEWALVGPLDDETKFGVAWGDWLACRWNLEEEGVVVLVVAAVMLRGLEAEVDLEVEAEVDLEVEAGKMRLRLVVVEANGWDLGEALNMNLEKGIECKLSATPFVEMWIAEWFQSIDMLEGSPGNPCQSVVESDSAGLDLFLSKQMTFRGLEEEVASVVVGFLA
jgi:hypothetical protein